METDMKYRSERGTVLNYLLTIMVVVAPSVGRAFYNPAQGRWLSRDPIGELGGVNLLVAVGNSPVSFVDSMGQDVIQFPTEEPAPAPPGRTLPSQPGPRFPIPSIPTQPRPTPPIYIPPTTPGPWILFCVDTSGCQPQAYQNCAQLLECKHRHPTWPTCRPDATSDPSAAVTRDAQRVIGWSGPYVTGVYPKGDAKKCPGGAPGDRYMVNVRYIRNNETGFQNYDMSLSVNCCKCCRKYTSGESCEVVHPSRGSGEQPYPTPIYW